MNVVAMGYVATNMNQNQVTNSSADSAVSTDFSDVLKTKYQNNYSNDGRVDSLKDSQDSSETVYNHSENVHVRDNHSETKVVKEDKSHGSKLKKAIEEGIDENGEIQAAIQEEASTTNETIEQEMMLQVTAALNVSEEELTSILEENGMSVMDMFEGQGLKDVLMSIYELSSDSELLQNQEVLDSFKELKNLFNNEESMALQKAYQNNELLISAKDQEALLETIADMMDEDIEDIAELVINSDATIVSDIESTKDALSSSIESKSITTSTEGDFLDQKVEIVDLRDESYVSDQESGMADDSQQSFANLFENVVENTTEVSVKANGDIVYREISANEILDQVVTKVKVELGNNNNSMSIQLSPEHLGKVSLTVSSENGNLSGSLVAENAIVKEILEANLINLKANLEEQGIKLDDIKVEVSSNELFEQEQQQNSFNNPQGKKSRKSLNFDHLEEVEEGSLEEAESIYKIGESGNSVEYSA